jgi:hypothetical protein
MLLFLLPMVIVIVIVVVVVIIIIIVTRAIYRSTNVQTLDVLATRIIIIIIRLGAQ